MTSFRIRPRFKATSDFSIDQFAERTRAALQLHATAYTGTVAGNYIVLKVKAEERHFWSPELQLSLEEDDQGKTLINGLYGPAPQVWTFFMFAYMAIALIVLFIAFIGMSKWMLQMEAAILWAIVPLATLALLLYIFAQIGQKIGAEQLFSLHHFLEDQLLGRKIHIH